MAIENPTPVVFGDPRLEQRFWEKIQIDHTTGCWLWLAGTTVGYGSFHLRVRSGVWRHVLAHRHAFEALIGPVPKDRDLDHFRCDTRRCVYPLHLRPVTKRENVLRGVGPTAAHAAKTQCPFGHPYDYVVPTTGARQCSVCKRKACRAYRLKKRASAA